PVCRRPPDRRIRTCPPPSPTKGSALGRIRICWKENPLHEGNAPGRDTAVLGRKTAVAGRGTPGSGNGPGRKDGVQHHATCVPGNVLVRVAPVGGRGAR